MSLVTVDFLCFKGVLLKFALIPIIAIIRSTSCAFQAHYFISCWQVNVSGGQKQVHFGEISVNRAWNGNLSLFKKIY